MNINNISDVSTFGPDAGIGAIESFDVYSSNDSFQMPSTLIVSYLYEFLDE